MYSLLSNLVKNKFYENAEAVLGIIEVFHKNNKLSDEEKSALIELVGVHYPSSEEVEIEE